MRKKNKKLDFFLFQIIRRIATVEHMTLAQTQKALVNVSNPFVEVEKETRHILATGYMETMYLHYNTENQKTVLVAQIWETDTTGEKKAGDFEIASNYIQDYDKGLIEASYNHHLQHEYN